MREILFRGKQLNNGEWIEGDYHRKKFEWSRDTIYHSIYPLYQSVGKEVDPDTISQYTGLKDKDGKKIFEGDIINDIDYGIMKCIYHDGSFVWYREDGFYIKCMNYAPIVEIIGNIYDNPELLDPN